MKQKSKPIPDDIRPAWRTWMDALTDGDDREYARASAAFGAALCRSAWLSRLSTRARVVGV